jgi:catechol 2,3-dioxygenase-like lactoylglutathione lyase family enzyme
VAFQVDTVFVWVTDLEESLPWYQMLGFTVGDRYGTWQVLDVDGETRFALHQGIRDEGPATAVISFRVDDLQTAIDRLGEESIRPIDQITDTGTTRFVTFRDPDGNEIQLLER